MHLKTSCNGNFYHLARAIKTNHALNTAIIKKARIYLLT